MKKVGVRRYERWRAKCGTLDSPYFSMCDLKNLISFRVDHPNDCLAQIDLVSYVHGLCNHNCYYGQYK